jgi:hypothetical protein
MLNLVIFLNIVVIVIVEEIVVPNAAIGKECNHRKNDGYGCNLPGLIGYEGRESGLSGR